MVISRAFVCALLMLCSTAVIAASAKKQPVGRSETLACRLGTEDRHARIAVVVVKGKTDSFAYYSKWKPRTCSIYLQRNRDTYSKWADNGNITTVNLERGAFLIEHKSGEYHFIFRDIDRERYCGMDGVINGSLIIRRGSEQCQLEGDIMVEGTPLGHAHAKVEIEEPGATAASPASAAPSSAPAVTTASPVRNVPTASALDTTPAVRRGSDAGSTLSAPSEQAGEPAQAAAAVEPQATSASSSGAPVTPQAPVAASSPPPAAATAKPAEAQSTSSVRSFFRSLSQQPPPEQHAQ